MAVDYKKIILPSLTEANVNLRGVTKTWGANWIYASGGLQNDITLIAAEIDQIKNDGWTPSASGRHDIATAAIPLRQVRIEQFVAGGPETSGALYLYGNTEILGNAQLYRIQVDNGTLAAVAVGFVGEGVDGYVDGA